MNFEILSVINQRERQILRVVHSCIYYRFDSNIVSDFDYDKWGRQLVALAKQYPQEFRNSVEYETFKGYVEDDCRSGFNLPFNRPDVVHKAMYLMKLNENKERD